MKESVGFFSDKEKIKTALSRMHDAIGVSYTCFSEVMEELDNRRVDLRPTPMTIQAVQLFKKANENLGQSSNPVEYWIAKAQGCNSVIEATRLYWEANRQQFPGVESIKNRIIFLANQGRWE